MRKIAVIPNISKDKDLSVTSRLIEYLEKYARVYVKPEFAGNLPATYVSEEAYIDAECAIAIGGDGTILRAAAECAENNIPILGINLGRIGFMTEVEVGEIEMAVDALIRGDYITEERMMLSVRILKNGEQSEYHALNDVVISKTDHSKLISMDLFSGGDLINRYIADGLIIATPTGSTGYSLSAGGPVVNPLMELFVTTPMCAHMLTSRPAIMPASEKLELVLSENAKNTALVTVDGEVAEKIGDTDSVIITKSEHKTKIIKIKRQSFYSIFIGKLS